MNYSKEDKQKFMLMQSGLVNDICRPLFDESGLSNYVFIEVAENGEFVYLNSSDKYYNELIDQEIIGKMPSKLVNPMIKSGLHLEAAGCKFIEQVFQGGIDSVNEKFNLGNFLFYVNKVEKDNQTVLQIHRFGNESDNKIVNEYYMNNIDKIVDFCHYVPIRMQDFFKQNKRLKFRVEENDIKDRILRLKTSTSKVDTDKDLVFYIKSKDNPYQRKKVILSPIERRIIRLSLKGYTSDMIANKIFVSRRTVEKYFTKIKKKLGCKYKLHIVGRLHELGVLDKL